MVVRSRDRVLSPALAALALMFALTACGDDAAETDGAQGQPAPSATTSPEPAGSPSLDGESTSPTPVEEPSPDDVSRKLDDRLLTAGQVPGLNAEFTWTVKSTSRREGRRPFGTCHKFDMMSIGATKVAVRRYTPERPDGDSTASNLVADFADEKTAERAYEVLKAWRAQCDDALTRFDRHEVGKLQTVKLPAATGPGNWYLLIYSPAKGNRDAGYFDAQGLTRVGKTVSVLQMRSVGQDYNYEAGHEPMVGAVRTSAAKLAG